MTERLFKLGWNDPKRARIITASDGHRWFRPDMARSLMPVGYKIDAQLRVVCQSCGSVVATNLDEVPQCPLCGSPHELS